MIKLESKELALKDIYDEIAEARGNLGFIPFIKRMIDAGIYNPVLEEFSDAQLIEIEGMIEHSRDSIFQVGGLVMLRDRYLINLGEPNQWAREYPQEAFIVTAMVLATTTQPSVRLDKVQTFYDAISQGKISLATPFLTNARRSGDHNSTASCFIMKLEDDLESITQGWQNAAHIASYGGGLGISLDSIRSTGASVRGIPKVSKGVASWLSVFNAIACAVDQAGSRKAAFTVSVGIHHSDVMDVIQCRKETEFSIGDERKRSPELFPQIVIHDNFMRAAEAKEDWYMFDPAELLRYHQVDLINTNGLEYEEAYDKAVALGKAGKLRTFTTTPAMDLVKEIIKCWVETGLPYIFFKSAANKTPIGSGQVYSANLCVNGVTKVLTEQGNVAIESLEGELVRAWNGHEWSLVQFVRTSTHANMVRVELSNGSAISCTDEHNWVLPDGSKVPTTALGVGTVLKDTPRPIDYDYDVDDLQRAQTESFLWEPHKPYETTLAYLKDASQGLVSRQGFYVFLRGVLSKSASFNGYIDEFSADPRVKIYCDAIAAYYLADALRVYGFDVNRDMRAHGEAGVPQLTFEAQHLFKLFSLLGSYAIPDLEIAYEKSNRDLHYDLMRYQNVPNAVRVVSVEDLNIQTSSYCAHEQHQQNLVFNGQITGNCVESFTPFDHYLIHVCNLVSLNLHYIPRDLVGHYAGIAVMMLNAVVDLTNKNLLSGAQSHNRMYRAIGIGIMGLSDYFAANEIHWRDPRAAEEAGSIMEDISYHALKTSLAMGATHPARCFQDPQSTWSDGLIYGKPLEWYEENSKDPLRWRTLHEKLKDNKPMNCYLISVAPNTSTARLWGVSASWLPRCQLAYEYIWNNTSIPIRPPIDDDRKWYYTIDKVLDQHYKIRVAEAMQKWIDQGISLELTCNLNEGIYDKIPTRKLWEWWLDVWKSGLKTIYYTSIIPVYMSDDDDKAVEPPCESCAV